MRRPRLARLLGAALLAAVLLPQTVVAATPATATTPPPIKLACSLVVPNPLDAGAPNRAIVCKWTAPTGVSPSTYRLWRSTGSGPRVLVARVAPTSPLRHVDRNIRTGYTYHYFVAAVNASGTRLAKSNVASVYVGRAPQTLAFDCYVVINGSHTWVSCHWSATSRATAVRYVVWRSVDGGARRIVDKVAIGGKRTFTDTNITAGQKIRYAVVAVDRFGRIVAYGSPDVVQIPK